MAFDETRRAAASQPTVCIYLLEALDLLKESLAALGLHDRIPMLVDQARLVVDGCEAAADLLPADKELVLRAFGKRFEPTARP